jgi:outer membrane protein assembly factor BamB
MFAKFKTLVLAALCIQAWTHSATADWPAWRGPHGDGITTEIHLPLHWSTNENVRWRVPLPEPGNSTPIVWGTRVFVTQPLAEGNRRALMCFDRADGRLLWQTGVAVEGRERTHETNPYASASPVTDGERVVCWFGSAGLVAYDFDGNELWRTDLGRHDHRFGYGGSPVIHGDYVFLNFGPGRSEYLVAVDKRTGKELWRHESPTPGQDDISGTWSTPFVVEWEAATQVISALRDDLAALDPATGSVIWRTPAFGNQAKASPVAGEGIVVLSGDLNSVEVAVRLGGRGEVTDTQVLWRRSPPKRRVATGVIHDGHIYGVQTIGIADCVKLDTGEVVWEERLTGSGANNAVWSSPVLAGERIYVMNQSGDTFVYRVDTRFEVLAVNSLGERSNSSVAPSNGELFLRTHAALWCIGAE